MHKPRAYPIALGHALVDLLAEQKPEPQLRGKARMDFGKSDRELFDATEIGDLWWDASLPFVWAYLYKNAHLRIPASWEDSMRQLNQEICAVSWLFSMFYTRLRQSDQTQWLSTMA